MTKAETVAYLHEQGWENIDQGWVKTDWILDGLDYESMALRLAPACEQAQREENFITL